MWICLPNSNAPFYIHNSSNCSVNVPCKLCIVRKTWSSICLSNETLSKTKLLSWLPYKISGSFWETRTSASVPNPSWPCYSPPVPAFPAFPSIRRPCTVGLFILWAALWRCSAAHPDPRSTSSPPISVRLSSSAIKCSKSEERELIPPKRPRVTRTCFEFCVGSAW